MKWIYLFVISALLCLFTLGSQNMQELAAVAVLGLGSTWIFAKKKKPTSH